MSTVMMDVQEMNEKQLEVDREKEVYDENCEKREVCVDLGVDNEQPIPVKSGNRRKALCNSLSQLRALLSLFSPIAWIVFIVVLFILFQKQQTEIVALRKDSDNRQSEMADLKKEFNDLKQQCNYSGDHQTRDIIIVEERANISELVNLSELIVKIANISLELSRLDSLSSTQLSQVQKIADHGQELLSIQTQLMELEGAQNSTTRNIARLDEDIRNGNSMLSARLNETNKDFERLSSALDTVSQSHDNHQVQISEIQRNITAIMSRQARVDSQLTSLQSGHQSQSGQISSLQTGASQLTDTLTNTNGKVASNERKINEADNHISSLQTDLSQAQNDRSDTKQRVGVLEGFHAGANRVSIAILTIFVCNLIIYFINT